LSRCLGNENAGPHWRANPAPASSRSRSRSASTTRCSFAATTPLIHSSSCPGACGRVSLSGCRNDRGCPLAQFEPVSCEEAQWHVDPLLVFVARAEARALLWQAGELTLHDATDELQAVTERDGLIEQIGQDTVQQILAHIFGQVRA
jgi:hypothetical protein